MKYLNMILATVLMSIVAAQAAQKVTFSDREVRDPKQLAPALAANAADAETRIAAVEAAVAGDPFIAESEDGLTNTVTITANDVAGSVLADTRLFRVWVSETRFGAPSATNIETLTLSSGTAVDTITANVQYIYMSGTNGVATATIVGTAAGTNYLNVADGGYVASEAVTFTE